MKLFNKNFIMILLIVILSVLTYFTMNYIGNNNDVGNHLKFENSKQQPSKPPNSIEEENSDNSQDNEHRSENLEKPDSNSKEPSSDNKMRPNNNKNMLSNKLNYIIFGIESLLIAIFLTYLVMSRFNKKTFKNTLCSFNKTMIFTFLVIIITIVLSIFDIFITNNYFLDNTPRNIMNKPISNENSNAEVSASTYIHNLKNITSILKDVFLKKT